METQSGIPCRFLGHHLKPSQERVVSVSAIRHRGLVTRVPQGYCRCEALRTQHVQRGGAGFVEHGKWLPRFCHSGNQLETVLQQGTVMPQHSGSAPTGPIPSLQRRLEQVRRRKRALLHVKGKGQQVGQVH